MTKQEAIEYCYLHEDKFKSGIYEAGENGQEQFDCLMVLLKDDAIKPENLADYGMDY